MVVHLQRDHQLLYPSRSVKNKQLKNSSLRKTPVASQNLFTRLTVPTVKP